MSAFVIEEWTLDPFPDNQAPRHIHHRGDEAFIVMDGTLKVEDGGVEYILEPGAVHTVASGSVHTFATVGNKPVRVLCVMSPEIASLIGALHDPGRPDKSQVWKDHHSTLVD
jgi:uncharacterized cupin superfamily protein